MQYESSSVSCVYLQNWKKNGELRKRPDIFLVRLTVAFRFLLK